VSEYVVVWSGSMKTPLTDGPDYRGCYLTDAAMSARARDEHFPTAKEMVGKSNLTGLQVRQNRPQVPDGRVMCQTCGAWIGRALEEAGYRKCRRCRTPQRRCACGKKVNMFDWNAGARSCTSCCALRRKVS
jgi:hypothetical protein